MKPCPYGLGCYRKRPEHFYEFSHPTGHKIAEKFAQPKNVEKSTDEKFGLYLSAVNSSKPCAWREMTFGKLLRLYEDLESCAHFNYMIDIDFVLQHHPNNAKLLLVSGDKLFSQTDTVPKFVFQCQVQLPPYGTHHTKMSILKFKVCQSYGCFK